MPRTKILACGAALTISALTLGLVPSALAGGSPPKVTVRVEGKTKELLDASTVQTHSGFVTKYGAPKKACPAPSAQGALDVATKGGWKGSYSTKYDEYFITRILGDTESGTKDFWEIFVNNIAASAGACQITLHSGDRVLFAVVPSTGKAETPLGLTAPRTATAGSSFTVKVVGYSPKGKASPLAGATVTANGKSVKSGTGGTAKLTPTKSGTLTIGVSDKGHIRDEATVTVK